MALLGHWVFNLLFSRYIMYTVACVDKEDHTNMGVANMGSG